MKSYTRVLSAWLAEESGQDLIEYALVVALVALVAVASLSSLAGKATTVLGDVGARLTSSI